jgi:NAD-specific glutamate dehydrogenase
LVEFETTFYVVDSFSDANNTHEINENLFVKEFTKSTFLETTNKNEKTKIPPIQLKMVGKNLGEIDEEEEKQKAITGAFTWMLYANTWFNNKQIASKEANNSDEVGVVRVFKIPFKDFVDIFEDKDTQNTFLFFGIKDYEATEATPEYLNEIELLLCSKQELKASKDQNKNTPIKIHIARDITTPYPPYTPETESFNLM